MLLQRQSEPWEALSIDLFKLCVVHRYPVILSIEQHCSISQQQFMAKQFIEVFGGL